MALLQGFVEASDGLEPSIPLFCSEPVPSVRARMRGLMSECPGCGLVLPELEGPAHAYIGSSPACWARYGELLAREYNDPAYGRLHQVTVDVYAVQHPAGPERRSIQSLALHLITLCLVLEEGADPRGGPKLHQRLAGRSTFYWLEPPRPNGQITVVDVLEAGSAAEHERRVEAWARNVWTAWEQHHITVRAWIRRELGDG
jgi:Family of unknown function (DUF5946)